MNPEKCGYVSMRLCRGRGCNAAYKNGTGLCDFKAILGMQIRRPGMGYVSKRQLREIIVLCCINWWGCNSI